MLALLMSCAIYMACMRSHTPLCSVAGTGSLFSLEVLHRMGLQFYEVATYAVATGVICLAVFRGLKRASFRRRVDL